MPRRSARLPRILGATAVALSVAPPLEAQAVRKFPEDPRVQVVTIPGKLPKPRQAAIVLPAGYASGARRYAVLYLLHGYGGGYDNWLTRTNLLAYTADLPLIVVMPDAGNSWYANAVRDTTQRFEDYVARDVVDYVDANYRSLPFPQARFIGGLSMGGYGALMLSLKNPGKYSLAASISGAAGPVRTSTDMELEAVFGPVGSEARKAADLVERLRTADPKRLPYFYLDCGTSDGLLASNREVTAVLAERGIPYEYHETHGAHEWEYWDRRIQVVLGLVRERIAALGR
ncbi:MAG TPA: alpha/beta hydrolase family protein [Longimicrobiales bacterium]|nr:alpha/beta hydrolase family protein [Longimicrobiales bacterium]